MPTLKSHLLSAVVAPVLLCSSFAQAQDAVSLPATDTLDYLTTHIGKRQALYLHQPLDSLLNKLKYPVKSYTIINWHFNYSDPLYLVLFFDDVEEWEKKSRRGEKPAYLEVHFEEEVDKVQALEIRSKGWGDWQTYEQHFYGGLMVEKIAVKRVK